MRIETLLPALLFSIALAAGVQAAPPGSQPPPLLDPAASPYKPDYAPETLPASNTQTAGSLQVVMVGVHNHGLTQGTQEVTVRLRLTPAPASTGMLLDGKTVPAPAAGGVNWVAFSPTLPAGVVPGDYWLCAHVSTPAAVVELSVGNNTHCAPLTVTAASASQAAPAGGADPSQGGDLRPALRRRPARR